MRGRGLSVIFRDNGFWACAAHVAVTPSTGAVKVERITLVVDPGIVPVGEWRPEPGAATVPLASVVGGVGRKPGGRNDDAGPRSP